MKALFIGINQKTINIKVDRSEATEIEKGLEVIFDIQAIAG